MTTTKKRTPLERARAESRRALAVYEAAVREAQVAPPEALILAEEIAAEAGQEWAAAEEEVEILEREAADRAQVEAILERWFTAPSDYRVAPGEYRLAVETEYDADGELIEDVVASLSAALPAGWTAEWLGTSNGAEEDFIVHRIG